MKTCIFGGIVENKYVNRKKCLDNVFSNTGNMLFWHSLNSILDADILKFDDCLNNKHDLTKYSSFVTTDLIWIQENAVFPEVKGELKLVGDKALVPISVGLQAEKMKKDFKLHDDTIALLAELQERAVLGVRGTYTAEILNKYGIKNIKVIGCPSLYYPFDYNFKITKKSEIPKNVSVNLRTMYSPINYYEQKFLVYSANRNYSFVEQTGFPLTREICIDMPTFDYLSGWLNDYKLMFFAIEDWLEFVKTIDFSMGCRFHGNVMSLWENKPALFITVDSRTTELTKHFSLPTISLEDFDYDKDIEYYYELADYSEFNKNYADRLHEFISFLKYNKLPIKQNCSQYYDRLFQNMIYPEI